MSGKPIVSSARKIPLKRRDFSQLLLASAIFPYSIFNNISWKKQTFYNVDGWILTEDDVAKIKPSKLVQKI